ncbi:MAG: hypothetical protein PF570_09845 [Candidatus Cloacimonetes bacterium]|jgi:hypothetical protein|nr:hypothetical protein [Candidatus Cloacimonadota bacterium]
MKFFKIIILILAVFLAISYTLTLIDIFKRINFTQQSLKFFLIGFGVFLPMWFGWFKRNHFFSTFEHELTHLLVGLLFFKRITRFHATENEGGHIALHSSNFVITLAPYFIPTFALLLLPLYLIINAEFYKYFYAVMGFFTSYHVFSTLQEFGFHQTDITKTGKVFSCIFLISANIVCYGFLITFVIGGFKFSWIFIKGGFLGSVDWIMWTVNFVKEII